MNKLPVLPPTSTAASTAFCAEKIEGPGGRHLWVDGNGKITASLGSLKDPRPNAFSILQVADCPYRTSICEQSCYVHNLQKAAPETWHLYKHNSETIRAALRDGTANAWSAALGSWIEENCPDFRWHVSGDVFSFRYAQWIRNVCWGSKSTRHWIYTRSVAYLEPLAQADNLIVNLSADAENYPVIRRAAVDYGMRICYLTEDGTYPLDLPDGSVIFPDYNLRAGKDGKLDPSMPGYEWFASLDKRARRMVCPPDAFGKSEKHRCGPCNKCMV